MFLAWGVFAQSVDTVGRIDTVVSEQTSFPGFLQKQYKNRSAFVEALLEDNILYKDINRPKFQPVQIHNRQQEKSLKDRATLFYILLCIFLLLALLHAIFKKYFQDIFRAFISPTLSRRQLKEQLHQTPFPGFMFNFFFTLSMGFYLYLLTIQKQYIPESTPAYVILFFVLFFVVIYLIKYLMLRFLGWALGLNRLMNSYIFTIFLINKILGIILLPVILILSFASSGLSNFIMDVSIFLVAILFIYRYIRAYPVIKSISRINKFHFFLYLCALEVAPILIIGKLFLIGIQGA